MKKSVLIICTALSLSACGILPQAYKVPVSQGNLITQEQLSQLEVGMSESQVTYLLGTPMLRDTFKPNEWRYVHTTLHAGPDTQKSDVSELLLTFSNGVLTDITNN